MTFTISKLKQFVTQIKVIATFYFRWNAYNQHKPNIFGINSYVNLYNCPVAFEFSIEQKAADEILSLTKEIKNFENHTV